MGKTTNSAESAKTNQTTNVETQAAVTEKAKSILDKVFIVDGIKGTPAEAKPEAEKAQPTPTEETPKQSPELFTTQEPKALTFAEMQAKINAELSRLKEQQERAVKRETLVNCQLQMKSFSEKLAQTENFEADFCRLSFQTLGEEYSRQSFKDSFLISNPAIIRKFCDILAEEVKTKIKEIETELING